MNTNHKGIIIQIHKHENNAIVFIASAVVTFQNHWDLLTTSSIELDVAISKIKTKIDEFFDNEK